ncbi:CmcJ/NvfI family oxidoreductase [Pseudomonas gingeri]|uniref:CmcJ/NvfI family oxidoreductase n=1 Tax=Pseudomonas gingeri TaxID=117681 RepID=UPI0015A48C42|nr:CmcJ/NvfI family oxidoreductase [Pseudomonas gingeri]NWA05832.1 methyltransferase [Pseudomonas gingeri]
MGTHQTRLAPASVLGVLNYLLDTGERPVNYTYPQPEGTPRRSGVLDPSQVSIHNAWLLDEPASIDRQGFEKVDHGSTVPDLEDEEQVREHYYPEIEALLKQQTGAVKVVIFDHTIRIDEHGREDRGLREPVRYVHNDQTERSAIRRVRDHLPADEAEQRLLKRFAIINVWRPIGAPVLSSPLALCDARSMSDGDLLPSDLVYRDKVGETFSVRANPAHRWYYYPHLQPDEALLLKIHDSRRDVARLSAHTAFDDPTTPADAPPRRSIEVRTLVFFDE